MFNLDRPHREGLFLASLLGFYQLVRAHVRLVFASARPCSLYFCPSSRVGCIVVIGMPIRDSHGMESPVASPTRSFALSRNKSRAWDSKITSAGLQSTNHVRGTPQQQFGVPRNVCIARMARMDQQWDSKAGMLCSLESHARSMLHAVQHGTAVQFGV